MRKIFFSLVLLASLLPAGTVAVTSPTESYRNLTTLVDVSGLALTDPVAGLSAGGVNLTLTPSLALGEIGPLALGVWSNASGATIESPGPGRGLYSTSGQSFVFAFSQVIRTFGMELAPYSDLSQDFTLRFFNGVTQIGQVDQTATTDIVGGDFILQAAVAGLTSTEGFDRVTVDTTGPGAVFAQLRLSTSALPVAADNVPEPASGLLVLACGLPLALAARRRR